MWGILLFPILFMSISFKWISIPLVKILTISNLPQWQSTPVPTTATPSKYEVTLSSPDEARTSLCHCHNCKVCDKTLKKRYNKVANSQTSRHIEILRHRPSASQPKSPNRAFKITSGKTKEHVADNGVGEAAASGVLCGVWGILEYGGVFSLQKIPVV